MLGIKRYIVLIVLLLWGGACLTAQSYVQPLQDSLAHSIIDSYKANSYDTSLADIIIQYEHDKAWPRWDYANNRASRQLLLTTIKQLATDTTAVRTIFIEGSASPIGSDKYNKALALRRADVLKGIVSKFEGGDKIRIYTSSRGEDWATFASYIRHRYRRSNRQAVLDIVESNLTNIEKERKLIALDNGKSWRLLVGRYMAPARNAVVVHILQGEPVLTSTYNPSFEYAVKQAAEPVLTFERPVVQTAVVAQEPTRYPVLAFRSNLLVPALNVGMEVPIGNHNSIGIDYYYPWAWPKAENKNCFELLGWNLEWRYWFGRNRTKYDRLQGHSLGVYGSIGYYDFEYNFSGHQGEFANVGIDYTFAKAVGKKKSVHFEFSIGIGCIYSQARKYSVIEANSPLISDKITKNVLFVGPTKANISLVVPIFKKVKPNTTAER